MAQITNLSPTQRRGSALVLAAVVLVVVLAFVAFSADTGYIVVAQAELQNAADAAAMAGARHLDEGPAAARTAATSLAAANTAARANVTIEDSDIQLGSWDEDTATFTLLSGAQETNANAVRVACVRSQNRGNPIGLFFAPMIGTANADLNVTATARLKSVRCGLIIGINKVSMSGGSHTNSYNSDSGPYNPMLAGSRGHVCTNGDITMSGSTAINGNGHPGPGKTVKSSSSIGVMGNIEPLTQPLSFPPVDPGNAPSVNSNSLVPNSDQGNMPLNGSGDFTLSGGDGVDLTPGTYYFNKISLSGGSTIRISGPTNIYVQGSCSLSGGSVANQTFLPKNLQLYVMGGSCSISGDSDFHGVVYAPTAKVVRSGDSDFYGSIVGVELTLSGSGGIHADETFESELLNSGVREIALVE